MPICLEAVASLGLKIFAMIRNSSANNLPPQEHFAFLLTPSSPQGTGRQLVMGPHLLESKSLPPLLLAIAAALKGIPNISYYP